MTNLISMILGILFLFIPASYPAAQTDSDALQCSKNIDGVIISAMLNGTAAVDFANNFGLDDSENIIEIYVTNDIDVESNGGNAIITYHDEDSVTYHGKDFIIKNVSDPIYERGNLIRRSEYMGPATGTMTVTQTFSATFNLDIEIKAKILEASLGYSTTYTFTVSDCYSVTVPDGYTYALSCYLLNEKTTFEVYEDDLFFDDYVGEYYGLRPIGYFFAVSVI